eukprot:Awhi_evm2s14397
MVDERLFKTLIEARSSCLKQPSCKGVVRITVDEPDSPKRLLYYLCATQYHDELEFDDIMVFDRKIIETCNDGILNQNEIGIDCGGICSDCS